MIAFKHLAIAFGLTGCTIVSGWSDLQGGKSTAPSTKDGGTSSASRDAGGGAADPSPTPPSSNAPTGLPACVAAEDEQPAFGEASCRCTGKCAPSCAGGTCEIVVDKGATSTNSCQGGICTVWCESGAECINSCGGGNCTFHCAAGSKCINSCEGGSCKIDCSSTDACINN